MEQRRYIEFDSDDDSFQFNAFLIGLIPAGLYRGFDFIPTNNLFLSLNHDTTGYQFPKIGGELSAKTGVVRSKQGVLIFEDTPISIQINANTSSLPRVDLVICEHQYQVIAGGVEAEYFVIQGTPNETPIPPVLTNPNFQVVIGQIYIPANTSVLDATGVIYTRPQLPELGNNNLQNQYTILQQNFNTLQQNFTILQDNFTTLSQTMQDWREYYKPVLRFDGVNIQWKWFGEEDTEWRDLAVAIITDCSGPGTMEVRVLEAQYLPNAEVWDSANPTQRDHNVLEFNTIVNLPNATYWINNREWIAPQTKNYRFLLDTLKLVCFEDIDYTALDTANEYPFSYGNPPVKTFWKADASTTNGFIRIELIKNETDIAFTYFHKFKIEDGTLIGDEILLPVIDEIIAAEAGDHFIWRVSIKPNYNNLVETIPEINGFNPNYNLETLISQANTSWVLKEHFQIESGHWTIFGM